MKIQTEIVNRVAQSGIITLKLEDYLPTTALVVFDIKDYLFRELVLREKDFRAAMREKDWSAYQGKHVALHCSTDAIVPIWAYMLVALYLEPYAQTVVFGDKATLETTVIQNNLSTINPEEYRDKRVVIKGCSTVPVPVSAYVGISGLLKPVVKTLMYGEPCSTVPLYKKPRKKA